MAEKVAVCLYGHIRTWENCKDSFVGTFNGLNPDVFVHTYDIKNTGSDVKYTNEQINNLLTGINVKTIVVEKNDDIYNNVFNTAQNYVQYDYDSHSPQRAYNVYSELRKINLCYQLLKQYETANNTKYTKIVFTRFDLTYKTAVPIDVSKLTDDSKVYNFYSGSPEPCDESVILLPRMAELFAVGRLQALDTIGTQHTWMGACPLCSHLIFRYCMIRAGIDVWNIASLGTCAKV